MAQDRQQQIEKPATMGKAPNEFAPAAEILGTEDRTGHVDGTEIMDRREDVEYVMPLAADADSLLALRGANGDPIYYPAEDRHGRPARTRKPIRGHRILMMSKAVYTELRRREQAALDRRDAALSQRAVSVAAPGSPDNPGGMGAPSIKVNRGQMQVNKAPDAAG
jgi:hypothetical protein